MTELNKAVSRVTRGAFQILRQGDYRAIVVTLGVGDVLEFREKGRRMAWSLPIDAAFRYAIQKKVAQDLREGGKYRKQRVNRGKLGSC